MGYPKLVYYPKAKNDKHRLHTAGGVFLCLRKERSKMPVIDTRATGMNIKTMIRQRGLKIADVQKRCGFNTPQAIFKWMRGDAVPTMDNMVIIADMFGVTIDQIIVTRTI